MATRADAPAVTDLAIPPGETLREELEARQISQRQLARLTGRSPQTIHAIVSGKQAVTAEMALALEAVLDGISARFWLNLQADHDLTVARARQSAGPR